MIDGIGSASRLRFDEDDHETGARQASPARSDAFVGSANDAQIDAGLAEFVRNANDDILHIGMNRSSAAREEAVLGKHARLTALAHGRSDGVIVVAGTTYDLKGPAGQEAFAGLLRERGLGSEQADAIVDAVTQTNPTGTDEMAHLALLWAAGERGGSVPSRIVLSGHSSGEVLWDGRGDGEIQFGDVRRLARVMPRAAAQIEDIHLSACSTGGQIALDDYRSAWLESFPNLRTIWAYDGAAPTQGGSDLAEWARATRGGTERLELTAARARQHVAVWDRVDGYRDKSEPLETAQARVYVAEERFADWTSGVRRPSGDGDAALIADYRAYRALASRSDVPADEREDFGVKADQLLRVRYFEGAIRQEIDKKYGAAIAEGFRALGMRAPSFASLSLREALVAIGAFERAVSAPGAPATRAIAQARTLLAGIRALDASMLEASWCRH